MVFWSLQRERRILQGREPRSPMDEIVPGDFVLMNVDWATIVGLVYKVVSGRAHVWWYLGEKLDQRPWIVSKEHPVSGLKIVGEGTVIPDSMMVLRSEHSFNSAYRIRRN
jgi:hypothetical protein